MASATITPPKNKGASGSLNIYLYVFGRRAGSGKSEPLYLIDLLGWFSCFIDKNSRVFVV